MSTKPRNPRYFPKMKVRGKRRRKIAPFQRLAWHFDAMGAAAAESVESLRALVESVRAGEVGNDRDNEKKRRTRRLGSMSEFNWDSPKLEGTGVTFNDGVLAVSDKIDERVSVALIDLPIATAYQLSRAILKWVQEND